MFHFTKQIPTYLKKFRNPFTSKSKSEKHKDENNEEMIDPPPLCNDSSVENQEKENMEKQGGKIVSKRKLFIGGLSYSTTTQELENYFSCFGTVTSSYVPRSPKSGKSKGYGFITFSNSEEAKAAVQNETHELNGKLINVRPYYEKENNERNDKARVFLGGVPSDITEENLKDFFTRYGEVVDVFIPLQKDTKKSKGIGFLEFKDERSAEVCKDEGFVFLGGRRVQIKMADPRGRFKDTESSGSSFSVRKFEEALEHIEKEDSKDIQSIEPEKEFLTIEEKPALFSFFETYFLEKLATADVMDDKKLNDELQYSEVTEVEELLADFLTFSGESHGTLVEDLIEFSSEESESENETISPISNMASSASSNMKMSDENKNSRKKSQSFVKKKSKATVFDDSESEIIQKSMPLQIKNKEGFLMCSLCKWISPNHSTESFLAHCKTSSHKTKLKDRFSAGTTNQETPGKSSNTALREIKNKNMPKNQEKKPPKKASNKGSKQGTDSQDKSEKAVTDTSKIHALARGLTSIQPFSKEELICKLCDKKIPIGGDLNSFMKNVAFHLDGKKHLKKLSEIENSPIKSTKKKNEIQINRGGEGENAKKGPKPKKISGSTAKKPVNDLQVKESVVGKPNEEKKSGEFANIEFLCLCCSILCKSIEAFNLHLSLKSHSDNVQNKNSNAIVGLTNMGKCQGCKAFLYGSFYDINTHCSKCV